MLKIPYDTVAAADFSDSGCEASAKSSSSTQAKRACVLELFDMEAEE